MELDSLESLYDFIDKLISKLASLHEYSLMEKLLFWSTSAFTTSTELMVELLIILDGIQKVGNLDASTRNEIGKLIADLEMKSGLRSDK